MIKKIAFIGLILLLLGLLLPAGLKADSSLAIAGSTVSVNFPASITFNITAASDVNITDIRLHYIVNRKTFAQIVNEIVVQFTPATRVTAQWVWDMRMSGGMPPGSSIDYWWTVTDASGQPPVETAPARVNFDDNRYNWRSLTQGDVTLYWYQGDDTFANELMAAVQAALSRLSDNTGAELQESVSLYIYASASDLQGSMIFPQEWTGGVAFTEYGIVAIGITPDASGLAWGKGAIAHELTHLVVHQVTLNPYNSIPTWLDEGLAMMAQGDLDPSFVSALSQAEANKTLISIRSLASPFSAITSLSLLSYAESYEVVNYLISEYGRDKMLELLNTFAHGSGYDDALIKVYGFDMDGLNFQWQAWLKGVPSFSA
jgi:hypothetical protein